MKTWFGFLAILSLGACGPQSALSSGSESLFSTIKVDSRPGVTEVQVELLLDGEPVSGAHVVVSDVENGEAATADSRAAGRYETRFENHVRTVGVVATIEEHHISAELEGPAPHVIISPVHNAILNREDLEALRIEWKADQAAEEISIHLDANDPLTFDHDPFQARFPLEGIRDGEQSLAVERMTQLELSGGTEGSQMISRYTVDNRFTLER